MLGEPVWTFGEEIISCPCPKSSLEPSVVQPLSRWASRDIAPSVPSALDRAKCWHKLHQQLHRFNSPDTHRLVRPPQLVQTLWHREKYVSVLLYTVQWICWLCLMWDKMCSLGIDNFSFINANIRTAMAMISVRPHAYGGYHHDNFSP